MLVSDMLQRLSLSPYADKQTKTYSGGNQRKLSVAIALIGTFNVIVIIIIIIIIINIIIIIIVIIIINNNNK